MDYLACKLSIAYKECQHFIEQFDAMNKIVGEKNVRDWQTESTKPQQINKEWVSVYKLHEAVGVCNVYLQ